MRTKHTFRLPPDLAGKLADYAARKGATQSLVVEAALTSHLAPDGADRLEAALARRLDRMSRQIERLERHVYIFNEALAVFVRARRHCRTPPWRRLKMDKGAPDRADHRPEVSVSGPVSRTIATDSSGLALQRSGGTGSPAHGQRQ